MLIPHGGPHADGDAWAVDDDAQFLARRGLSRALQMDFRCSTDRGRRFEEAGYLQWGGRTQDDLLDGLHWSIAQDHTDPARICTYGASFATYSAMLATAKAPDLIRCAVGFAGIFDLARMHTKGDILSNRLSRNYLIRVIGRDPAQFKVDSPVSDAAGIRAAVLVIHVSHSGTVLCGKLLNACVQRCIAPESEWAISLATALEIAANIRQDAFGIRPIESLQTIAAHLDHAHALRLAEWFDARLTEITAKV